MAKNIDKKTVEGFGDEWSRFTYDDVSDDEIKTLFARYFDIFPFVELPSDACGFDAGCGSGRWARLVAPWVGTLYCVDASSEALGIAERKMSDQENCRFLCSSIDDMAIADSSMDFGYSLGVLHHMPDTVAGIEACVAKLKPGAPFLLYLYYAFDNRPAWFRAIWRSSDFLRRGISRLPHTYRYWASQFLAATVYYPLARSCLLLEKSGASVSSIPLSSYRRTSFYTMRTDALDRFGTRLEQRFTASQVENMMATAGLERIRFSENEPYWCAVGYKIAE